MTKGKVLEVCWKRATFAKMDEYQHRMASSKCNPVMPALTLLRVLIVHL
jgi:hypothetical protein